MTEQSNSIEQLQEISNEIVRLAEDIFLPVSLTEGKDLSDTQVENHLRTAILKATAAMALLSESTTDCQLAVDIAESASSPATT